MLPPEPAGTSLAVAALNPGSAIRWKRLLVLFVKAASVHPAGLHLAKHLQTDEYWHVGNFLTQPRKNVGPGKKASLLPENNEHEINLLVRRKSELVSHPSSRNVPAIHCLVDKARRLM